MVIHNFSKKWDDKENERNAIIRMYEEPQEPPLKELIFTSQRSQQNDSQLRDYMCGCDEKLVYTCNLALLVILKRSERRHYLAKHRLEDVMLDRGLVSPNDDVRCAIDKLDEEKFLHKGALREKVLYINPKKKNEVETLEYFFKVQGIKTDF